jgi:hypothetical protein
VNNPLYELSKSLNLPIEDVGKAFEELKSKGLFCTPARSAKEFASNKYPIRLAGSPPTSSNNPAEVSFGPFALERKHYEYLWETVTDPDALSVLLGFVRLAYEKVGVTKENYEVEAEEDVLYEFLSLMPLWDSDNPVVGEHFVWILPTNECKDAVQSITGESYNENDFSWWNVRIDLERVSKPLSWQLVS